MGILATIMALFMCGCVAAASINNSIDNSPAEMAKREARRKELCAKKHYNVNFVRVGGKLELHKIHVELSEQTGYECKF